jgi:hypothetical protein
MARECAKGGGRKARAFFFEKKNQKTFIHLWREERALPHQTTKSLFASFSSEKEDSYLKLASSA